MRHSVARLIAMRLGQATLTAWVIATLCFFVVQALPGDAALSIAAARVGEERVTPEAAARIKREEGLDRPVFVQYGSWMARLATLDLGRSMVTRKRVVDDLAYHASFTLSLGLIGWLLSYAIALPFGIAAGFYPGGLLDRAATGLSVIFVSLPTFLIGIALISVFALTFRVLPPAGYRTSAHMVLPALTLALSLAAYSVPMIRNAVVEVRGSFFMTYARIRGLGASKAFQHHGIRNAAIPVITFAALQFAFVVDGFVIIETLFNYPGLGELLVRSLVARDIPVIMGAGLLIGLLYALVNLAVDLIALALDPRRRTEVRS